MRNENEFQNYSYLQYILEKKLLVKNNKLPLYKYNFMKSKRFFMQTAIVFFIQYLTISVLDFSSPFLPLYPLIGISFVMHYFIGNNALLGLFLGGALSYLIKDFSFQNIILYLIADILIGILASLFAQKNLSSDIKPFENRAECIQFIKINAILTFISALIKISTHFFIHTDKSYHWIADFVTLWMAELNGILVFAGFFLSWFCVPFSREKINYTSLKSYYWLSYLIVLLLACLFLKSSVFWYITNANILTLSFLTNKFGSLISTALLFITVNLYLIYFLILKFTINKSIGYEFYLLSAFILLFCICSILLRNSKKLSFNIN